VECSASVVPSIAFDVKCSLIELSVDVAHGFESVVLEYLFTNFIPDIFLRVQFGRVRREEMQDDIGGDLEFIAAVIAGSVHKKQDQFLRYRNIWISIILVSVR
jgi:hypothetical protein